jgi:hypothetical protein
LTEREDSCFFLSKRIDRGCSLQLTVAQLSHIVDMLLNVNDNYLVIANLADLAAACVLGQLKLGKRKFTRGVACE